MKIMNNIIRRHSNPTYKRCAFTGYRLAKLSFGDNEADPRCVELKARLRVYMEELIGRGYAHFLSGGALGVDCYAAEIVLDLQKRYPWILLEMAVPFDGQTDKWNDEWKARHERLLACADIITATGHAYTKGCFFRRNRYLVDNCDTLLAVYDGQSGGTAMTVAYARECGREILCIRPDELRAMAS